MYNKIYVLHTRSNIVEKNEMKIAYVNKSSEKDQYPPTNYNTEKCFTNVSNLTYRSLDSLHI